MQIVVFLNKRYGVAVLLLQWKAMCLWPLYKQNPMHRYYFRIESEYDQEIPQSQTAYNPVAPRGRAPQPSRDTRKTN